MSGTDPFPNLSSEIHLAGEALLREAAGYLARLPPHPMTRELAAKLQRHLDDPRTGIIRERDELIASAQAADLIARKGANRYTPAGIPALEVSVEGGFARVESPAAKIYGDTSQGRSFGKRLVEELARGVTVELGARMETPRKKP